MFKTNGETEYAQVTKKLGNTNRVETLCFADGRTRQCKTRGSTTKQLDLRFWIEVQDIVLISLRDFQDAKAEVIFLYTDDEAWELKRSGALPDSTTLKYDPDDRRVAFFDESDSGDGGGGLAQNEYETSTSESASEEEELGGVVLKDL